MPRKLALFMIAMVLSSGAALLMSGGVQTQSAPPAEAFAVVHPASGSNCRGIVRFSQAGASVRVVADLEGLTAGAEHGFHIHEFGDCSAADAASAGSHYDARLTKHHGRPTDTDRHSGDLGNIRADAAGKAHYEITVDGISILGGESPIAGRGVIVHERPDDFSQPVGNAGGRIGCGVIGISKTR